MTSLYRKIIRTVPLSRDEIVNHNAQLKDRAKALSKNKFDIELRKQYLESFDTVMRLYNTRRDLFLKSYSELIDYAKDFIERKEYVIDSKNIKESLQKRLFLFKLIRLMGEYDLIYDANTLINMISDVRLRKALKSTIREYT